jgi:hypothetical protein
MEMSKETLMARLREETEALLAWYAAQGSESMERGPEGAWSAGQHLLHLIKSSQPLSTGLGYPRILLRWKFGAINGSGSYEEVVARYAKALDNGGKAMGAYVPREVRSSEYGQMVQRFRDETDKLCRNLAKWSEKDLDRTGAPHPLIGMLTVRELLYFTIYHIGHHRQTLQSRY